jgi:iron complex transport system substrate-binding protein
MSKYKWLMVLFSVTVCLLAAACTPAKTQTEASAQYLTIQDDANRTVVLAEKPERIVALSTSFLEPLGAVKANIVGRVSSKTGVPQFAEPIEEVGAFYQINIEKVIALQPDLVIAFKGVNDKFVPILESNHIPVIVLQMKTYEDVKAKITLFASITGEVQKGEDLIKSMDDSIQGIKTKIPSEHKKVAILHSTAQNVTVELDGSIAGSIAKSLGFMNVAATGQPLEKNPDATPYSLETLVEQDPDIIFVTSMGKMDEIKKSMSANVENNPAWSSLRAVKNKQLYFLPQNLFLLNPGIDYPNAVATMAKLVYPEVFNDAK